MKIYGIYYSISNGYTYNADGFLPGEFYFKKKKAENVRQKLLDNKNEQWEEKDLEVQEITIK